MFDRIIWLSSNNFIENLIKRGIISKADCKRYSEKCELRINLKSIDNNFSE